MKNLLTENEEHTFRALIASAVKLDAAALKILTGVAIGLSLKAEAQNG